MIKRNLSLYLDVLRFGAAFVVLISHFGYERYTSGRYLFVRDLNLGSDAVVIFFVLSGMVITFTGQTKDKTLGRFTFNRATRLISVAVPAVLLTYFFDRFGASIRPEAYDGWWYNPLDFSQMLFSGLTFSSEWTGQQVRLGTNGPYWSLSYEVAYYILFGLALYLKSPVRWGLIALVSIVFGFNVMILLPAWLVGVWVYNRLQDGKPIEARLARLMAVVPVLLYAAMLAIDLPDTLKSLTTSATSADTVRGLRFSDEFVWNWLIAGLFALHLLGMASLLRDHAFASRATTIRWLAGASFSVYLVHYPVIQFFSPLLPKTDIGLIDDAILLAITMVICFGFAAAFERQLKPFRRLVYRVAGRESESAPPRVKQPAPTP